MPSPHVKHCAPTTQQLMDKVVGEMYWDGEDTKDGHEMGCCAVYHDYLWLVANNEWSKKDWFCLSKHTLESASFD